MRSTFSLKLATSTNLFQIAFLMSTRASAKHARYFFEQPLQCTLDNLKTEVWRICLVFCENPMAIVYYQPFFPIQMLISKIKHRVISLISCRKACFNLFTMWVGNPVGPLLFLLLRQIIPIRSTHTKLSKYVPNKRFHHLQKTYHDYTQ